jgi:hypothetical protein
MLNLGGDQAISRDDGEGDDEAYPQPASGQSAWSDHMDSFPFDEFAPAFSGQCT